MSDDRNETTRNSEAEDACPLKEEKRKDIYIYVYTYTCIYMYIYIYTRIHVYVRSSRKYAIGGAHTVTGQNIVGCCSRLGTVCRNETERKHVASSTGVSNRFLGFHRTPFSPLGLSRRRASPRGWCDCSVSFLGRTRDPQHGPCSLLVAACSFSRVHRP